MAEEKTTTAVPASDEATPAKEEKKEAKAEANADVKVVHEFKGKYIAATGKRKTSIAQVRLYKNGSGVIVINEMDLDKYFPKLLQETVKSPLVLVNREKDYDWSVKVYGGGKSSQAQAVRHGISKILVEVDKELRKQIKKAGFLTRDPRIKERKKYGLKRARRAPQWKKR